MALKCKKNSSVKKRGTHAERPEKGCPMGQPAIPVVFHPPFLQEKEGYYSAFSHLFRNPLNSVIGYVDYLIKGYAGLLSDDQLEQMGFVRESALHLDKRIDILMQIMAFDLGLISLNQTPIQMIDFLEEMAREAEPIMKEEKMTLSMDLPESMVLVSGDATWLRIMIQEVLTNAVRVTPPHASIDFQLREEGGHAVVRVMDQGPGVPQDKLKWIFEPMTQLQDKNLLLSGEKGGLGLSLVARAVKAHHGHVWAENHPKGKGLIICVKLPLIKREICQNSTETQ